MLNNTVHNDRCHMHVCVMASLCMHACAQEVVSMATAVTVDAVRDLLHSCLRLCAAHLGDPCKMQCTAHMPNYVTMCIVCPREGAWVGCV